MRYIRFGQCQFNQKNLKQSFLAEKKHLAENQQLAETYIFVFIRFGQWPKATFFFYVSASGRIE
jgi:hypothetical protein